jgi:hypothetical protein
MVSPGALKVDASAQIELKDRNYGGIIGACQPVVHAGNPDSLRHAHEGDIENALRLPKQWPTLATRNIKHFADLTPAVVNPWEAKKI